MKMSRLSSTAFTPSAGATRVIFLVCALIIVGVEFLYCEEILNLRLACMPGTWFRDFITMFSCLFTGLSLIFLKSAFSGVSLRSYAIETSVDWGTVEATGSEEFPGSFSSSNVPSFTEFCLSLRWLFEKLLWMLLSLLSLISSTGSGRLNDGLCCKLF